MIADTKYNFAAGIYPAGIVLEKTGPHYVSQAAYVVSHYDYEPVFFRPVAETSYTLNGGSSVYTGIFKETTYNVPSTDAAYNIALRK